MFYTLTTSGTRGDVDSISVCAHKTAKEMYETIVKVNREILMRSPPQFEQIPKYWSFCEQYTPGDEIHLCEPCYEEVESAYEDARRRLNRAK